MKKLYPDSAVELKPFTARNYDKIMNTVSFGVYKGFIRKAIKSLDIRAEDSILDMGCGTGRNAALMLSYLNKKGKITGLDISPDMEKQFTKRFADENRVEFINKRIDQEFDLEQKYDKIFISFVLHGFPHEIRKNIVKNTFSLLKNGGSLHILDYEEFNILDMPGFDRWVFKKVECKYAFDFIEKDWKQILASIGYSNFKEHLFMKKYVRLLKAEKA